MKQAAKNASSPRAKKISVIWKYICYGLLLSCIPLIVLSLSFAYTERDNIVAAEIMSYNKVAESAANLFFEYVQSMQSAAISMASEQRLQDRQLGERAYNDLQAIRVLQSYRKMLPFVSEIGFYTRSNPDIIYYSDGTWRKEIFTKYVITNESMLEEALSNNESIAFSGWSEREKLCVCSTPISYISNSAPKRVCFFVLTSRSIVNSFSMNTVSIPNSSVAGIWNDKGKMLFYNQACASSAVTLNYMRENDLHSVSESDNYFFSGASNGYQIMLYTPMSTYEAQLSAYNSSLSLLILISVLLCFALVGAFAYFSYMPIKKLMISIGLYTRAKSGAEFNLIREEYNKNTSRLMELMQTNEENNRMLLSHVLEKQLSGVALSSGDDAILDKAFGGRTGDYFAAVTRVSSASSPAMFSYEGENGRIYTAEMFSDGFIVYIMKVDNRTRDRELVETVFQRCGKQIGVGRIGAGLESLHTSYLEAILALTRGDESRIAYYESVPASENERTDADKSVSLIQITRMIKNGDNEVLSEIGAMFDAIAASDRTPSTKKFACFQLIQKLQQSMQKMNLAFTDEQAAQMIHSGSIELMKKACLEQLENALQCIRASNIERIQELSENIMRTVEAEYDNNAFNISMLSDAVGISEYTAGHIFKEITGQSLQDYLKRKRIDAAKELLIATETSVSDIALNVGFSSCSYFIRVFKAEEGMTPAAYRQTQKQ